jgi:cardiolipin synthase
VFETVTEEPRTPSIFYAVATKGVLKIRVLRFVSLLNVCMALCCVSTPPLPEGLGGYIALEAWRGESSLNLKYMGPDGLVYSLADWQDERLESTKLPDAVSLLVLNPDETSRTPWSGRPESAQPIPVLHASDYWRFRNSVLSTMVPSGGQEAVVVELGEEEVALYFEPDGRFRSLIGPPPDPLRVVRRFSLEDYLAAAPAKMESVLVELGISEREVLFNTGDVGEDALPFLYANLDTNLGAFVRVQPLGQQQVAHSTLVPVTRSLVHLLQSHTTSLVNRPLTSIVRLLFAASDAARDTLDGAALRLTRATSISPLNDGPAMDLVDWESELDRIIGRPAQTGRLDFLIDGKPFFTRLERAVRDSRSSILMRTYIFDNDDYALEYADLLRARSAHGVDVRVLVDGIGTLSALAEKKSKISVRRIANPFFTGDHTKTIVIDEEVAYLGGMNIAREYRYEWHDMMVEVHGPVVARLADDFDVAWAAAGPWGDLGEFFARLAPERDPGPKTGYPVRVLYTTPTASEIRRAQLEAIRRSQKYIYLQNAYLTDDAFLRELVRARRRGVDVRVVVALESDRGLLTRDNIVAANILFEHGIRVFIYPGMSHIKAAIFDGWACLGSANLDQLSLRVNKETNIATSEPIAVDALEKQLFEKDFKASPEMREMFPERWNDVLWELVGDYVF